MENKTNETKEVTMEQLMKVIEENHKEEMKHLKEIEKAQALGLNCFNTLFQLMLDKNDELKLEKDDCDNLGYGLDSLNCCIETLFELSGMRKTEDMLLDAIKNAQVKVITNIDDLMKELFK